MSKNEKLTKQDIKGPDMFQTNSERLFQWIEENARAIASVLLITVVVAIGAVVYGHIKTTQEEAAAEALFKPEMELKNAETKFRESQAAKMEALAGGKKAPVEPAKADYAKDYAPSVTKLTETIKAHAGTKAAVISALNLSNFLIEQKQYETALQVVQTPTYKPGDSNLLGGFWRMHRGLVMIENKKPDEALAEYKAVIDAKALKYFHAEALLKSGIAFEMKNELDKARSMYEKVDREHKGSEASATASQYLRLLDLKPQQG